MLASSLTKIIKKFVGFKWGEEQETPFLGSLKN
jgi:hypothetical protein